MTSRMQFVVGLFAAALVGTSACGSDSGEGAKAGAGEACTAGAECASGVCVDGACVGDGEAPPGTACVAGTQCASGRCVDGICAEGDPAAGSGGASSGSGATGATSSGSAGAGGSSGPQFFGAGESFRPLTPGCGPDTAALCTGACEGDGEGSAPATVIRPPATLCFSGEGDPTPDDPSAIIEQVIERVNGQTYVHLRVTFDPAYVDNTYGTGTSDGWGEKGHKFRDLVGSDHTELRLTNGAGETVMEMKLDLVSESATAPCGYETLGVSGGEGKVITGDPAAVLAVATSISRNLNGCGYCDVAACEGDCTLNSPATDEVYAPNDGTPDWDYRQAYEAWIDLAAFGDAGFGQAYITYTHASPSKVGTTITVTPTPCPPCLPGDPSCFGSPPNGGSGGSGAGGQGGAGGGSGGSGGNGGASGTCPPNYQIYIASEGESTCTPVPYANYPGMSACPAGFVLDTASEGQYCLPSP